MSDTITRGHYGDSRLVAIKCLRDEEHVDAAIHDFLTNAQFGDSIKICIIYKLEHYLINKISRSNSLHLSQWSREYGIPSAMPCLCAEIVFRGESDDVLLTRRRKIVRQFIDELAEAEVLDLSGAQKDVLASEILEAIERGLRPDALLVLPTHEELLERRALYVDRPHNHREQRRQTIIEFLETGWPAQFIAAGLLTRPEFRRIDPQAEQALRNWVRETGQKPPEHLRIPTKTEVIDRELSQDPELVRGARRLLSAYARRRASPSGAT